MNKQSVKLKDLRVEMPNGPFSKHYGQLNPNTSVKQSDYIEKITCCCLS